MTSEPISAEDIRRYEVCVRAEKRMRQAVTHADRRIGLEPEDLERLLAALAAGELLAEAAQDFMTEETRNFFNCDYLEAALAAWRARVAAPKP